MKFVITASKPRNPVVAAARLRRAGSHRADQGALRQRHARQLRDELGHLDRHKHSP